MDSLTNIFSSKSLISFFGLWSEEEVMFLVKFGTTVNTDRLRTIVKLGLKPKSIDKENISMWYKFIQGLFLLQQ